MLVEVYFLDPAIFVNKVMFISIFLAIAVDKLSEVKSLEEDTMEETEKLLERRKEREEQISALKNPNEPQIQRRTIRRVVKYLADNPAERVKQLHRSEALKKMRKRPLTVQLDLKRGSSLITPSGSAIDPHRSSYHRSTSDSAVNPSISEKESESCVASAAVGGAGESSVAALPPGVSSRKQRNPLRLMKRTSDYFEMQKMRLGSLPSSSTSQSAHSSVSSFVEIETSRPHDHDVSRKPLSASTAEDSVFDMQPHTILRERHFSVTSTPESSKSHVHDHPLCVSYERTQSYPSSGVHTSEIEVNDSYSMVTNTLGGGGGGGNQGGALVVSWLRLMLSTWSCHVRVPPVSGHFSLSPQCLTSVPWSSLSSTLSNGISPHPSERCEAVGPGIWLYLPQAISGPC